MNRIRLMMAAVMIAICVCALPAEEVNQPKREFRGAWLHTVFQDQYLKQTTAQNQAYLIGQLDSLERAGVNAILWQVRPCADAFYQSNLEPWSRFLTSDGKAPSPYWDPLQFMIDEAHKRGMELHAWLNPYRVTATKAHNNSLPKNHIYHKEKDRFVVYDGDGKLYFDPGLPVNRKFITDVVMDIINRYDVDAIHFDDYFYPYPAAGKDFPDDKSYAMYGNGKDRGDWRRENVDLLIEDIHSAIASGPKPWVRFGISPFGIWRNKKSDPRGSDTNGLENYDALYADVLLWAEKGWIDYLLPQLYWTLEYERASSLKLAYWWAEAVPDPCQLYIGQDVVRTMKTPDIAPSALPTQLNHKVRLSRTIPGISGNCWWPGYEVSKNTLGVLDSLSHSLMSQKALVPEYPSLSSEKPARPDNLKYVDNEITWSTPALKGKSSDAVKFVVYRFDTDAEPDIDNGSAIVAVTASKTFTPKAPGMYMISSLSRTNIESDPAAIIVE